MNCKKKKKKRIPHCNFQTCYRKQTCFFFFWPNKLGVLLFLILCCTNQMHPILLKCETNEKFMAYPDLLSILKEINIIGWKRENMPPFHVFLKFICWIKFIPMGIQGAQFLIVTQRGITASSFGCQFIESIVWYGMIIECYYSIYATDLLYSVKL